MTTRHLASLALALAGSAFAPNAAAHCQIPCGIYNDDNVIEAMHTDYVTIEKACKQIEKLLEEPVKNAHQIARWITNKEAHATSIQDTVNHYFLAQRLKLDEADSNRESYLKKLTLCHKVIVTAMNCKQSTDLANAKRLHDLLHEFEKLFGTKK